MALLESAIPGLPVRRGKVRDVYDLGDGRLLMVATDRISAFDWVLPTPIPDKGRVLTGISAFWFGRLKDFPNHLISTEIMDAGLDLPADVHKALTGRSMIVRKAEVIPFECVVRGYLAGSAWAEYRASGTVCGEPLQVGHVESDPLRPPLFTPATKADSGHDENISFERFSRELGASFSGVLRGRCRRLFETASELARARGLILADTKFEWGRDLATHDLMLIDEVLTPDSSRYWDLQSYKPGGPQPSFDKQFVRDWLSASGWDRASPPPALPEEIVAQTRAKYIRAFEMLTQEPFPWT